MGIMRKLGHHAEKAVSLVSEKLKRKPAESKENKEQSDADSPLQSERQRVGKNVESVYRTQEKGIIHGEVASNENVQYDEKALLKEHLEVQYPKMKSILERYEISTQGMPTWDQVRMSLTPEVLDKALKITEPTLLLVPPISMQSMVESMNKHLVMGQKETWVENNNDLWNGGNSKTENKWKVLIVEGTQNVPEYKYKEESGLNTYFIASGYNMSKHWIEKYEKEGLDVLNDAIAYLSLMIKSLTEGKPIDSQTFTLLNGKNITKSSRLAVGHWDFHSVVGLYPLSSHKNFRELRLRGLVEVDVPEAA